MYERFGCSNHLFDTNGCRSGVLTVLFWLVSPSLAPSLTLLFSSCFGCFINWTFSTQSITSCIKRIETRGREWLSCVLLDKWSMGAHLTVIQLAPFQLAPFLALTLKSARENKLYIIIKWRPSEDLHRYSFFVIFISFMVFVQYFSLALSLFHSSFLTLNSLSNSFAMALWFSFLLYLIFCFHSLLHSYLVVLDPWHDRFIQENEKKNDWMNNIQTCRHSKTPKTLFYCGCSVLLFVLAQLICLYIQTVRFKGWIFMIGFLTHQACWRFLTKNSLPLTLSFTILIFFIEISREYCYQIWVHFTLQNLLTFLLVIFCHLFVEPPTNVHTHSLLAFIEWRQVNYILCVFFARKTVLFWLTFVTSLPFRFLLITIFKESINFL